MLGGSSWSAGQWDGSQSHGWSGETLRADCSYLYWRTTPWTKLGYSEQQYSAESGTVLWEMCPVLSATSSLAKRRKHSWLLEVMLGCKSARGF